MALELGKLSLSLRSLENDTTQSAGHTATWDHHASLALRMPENDGKDSIVIVRGSSDRNPRASAAAGGGQ